MNDNERQRRNHAEYMWRQGCWPRPDWIKPAPRLLDDYNELTRDDDGYREDAEAEQRNRW